MFDFMSRILGGKSRPGGLGSKSLAKERLKVTLACDRVGVSPQVFEGLRVDLARAVSKYVEIDEAGMSLRFDSTDRRLALVASMPVIGMRRGSEACRRGKARR
ncbi:MAG: cell division topological specificity factor MinE [Firmicutes bacterium]|nr:cell division topological specificity factor MinE [Bacillota bacterium]MDH7494981.1 cell division topological specificity factor MinE [Bacillota bacterium]